MSGTNCRPPTTIGIIAFDFGDRFLLSMLHWCGIGRRSTSLAYWKVFLLRSAAQVVGVFGPLPATRDARNCLLGWVVWHSPSISVTRLWHTCNVSIMGLRPKCR